MNKNTIIKLIAVLAMCFLIGGALVACKGAAGPAGPQGPQGEKGETGAAGSTPELTIGANGNWFADGVDLGVKAPSADAACAEHDFAYVDVVKHTQTEDGIVVKACKTCGFAAITNETLHVMKDGEIPANCLEAKWVGSFCEICNFKGEGKFVGEALGHDWTKAQPVTHVATEGYICIDGGMLVQHCKACKEIKYTTVGAGEYPHTIYNWAIPEGGEPTELKFGTAYGTCTICGKTESYDLPLITSDEWAVKEITAVSCGQDGKYEYTYVNADRNINLTFELKKDATGHKLNGQNFANYDINDGTSYTIGGVVVSGIVVPYWYGTADASGRLPALNVNPFAGQTFECEKTMSGYFYCEECKDVVNVAVFYDHNGKTEIVTEATCCSVGYKKVDCDNCAFDNTEAGDLLVVAKLPHVYTYEPDEVGTTTIDNNEVKLYNLVGTCKGNNTTGVACAENASKILAENIYNVDPQVIKDPNCLEYGQIKYTFNKLGLDAKFNETVLVPKTNHILDGKEVEDYTALTSATSSKLKLFAGDDIKNYICGAKMPAYFFCEYCSTVEGVEPIVKVEITKAHTKVNPVVTDEPTCTEVGYVTYSCSNQGCPTPDSITDEIPATGHTEAYAFVEGDASYEYYAVKYCTVCETELERTGINNYTELAKVPATCYSEGYELYKVTINGAVKELKIVKEKINHTLAGLVVDSPKFNALYKNSSGAISTVAGAKFFAMEGTPDCEASYAGYFVCEACAKVGIESLVEVTVFQPHVEKEVVSAPTCTTPGLSKCANGDHTFTTPETGHDYALDYEVEDGYVYISGKCKVAGCVPSANNTECEKTWTFELPDPQADSLEDFLANGDDVYTKPVLVKAATCVEAAKYAVTVNFDAEGNAIALENLADSLVFITVTFEFDTVENGHDYEKCTVLTVVKTVVDEETEENVNVYYIVNVCNACGNYDCVKKIVGDEAYAEYLESLKNA